MSSQERGLLFAEFDPKRPETAPTPERDVLETGKYAKTMARREGFEPPWSLCSHSSLADRSYSSLAIRSRLPPQVRERASLAMRIAGKRRLPAREEESQTEEDQ